MEAGPLSFCYLYFLTLFKPFFQVCIQLHIKEIYAFIPLNILRDRPDSVDDFDHGMGQSSIACVKYLV